MHAQSIGIVGFNNNAILLVEHLAEVRTRVGCTIKPATARSSELKRNDIVTGRTIVAGRISVVLWCRLSAKLDNNRPTPRFVRGNRRLQLSRSVSKVRATRRKLSSVDLEISTI